MLFKKKTKEEKLEQKRLAKLHEEMITADYYNRKKEKILENDSCISLQHINKIYPNHVQAVYDFNLEIKDKEFIVFVGPSGCGKSTTLRMIAGLEDITYGDLYIGGNFANDLLPKQRNVAMVFQSYALYPNMTVYENMAFSLKVKKINKQEIDERVRNAAKILEITDFLDRKPAALSGGQRQRVALGRAIVRNAKVFLMDEPLSNLDAKLRVNMRSEIVKLHQRIGSTTIYVTHDQTEAMTMADRIVVMKDGFIQQIGTPKEIYEQPNNVFVATFIGAPSMNIIDSVLSKNDVLLPNGFAIKLSKEQLDIIDKFYESKINECRNNIAKFEKEIKDRTYILSRPQYQKDLKKFNKEKQKYLEIIAGLTYLVKMNADNESVASIVESDKQRIKETQAHLEEFIKTTEKGFENKEYQVLPDAKLNELLLKDETISYANIQLEKLNHDMQEYQKLKSSQDKEILFGIRPEDLVSEKSTAIIESASDLFSVKINVAELLGNEYYLHFNIGEKELIAKINTRDNFKEGDELKLAIDLARYHIFDKKSKDKII